MKNVFGNALTVTLFGESHGPAIGAVLDGLAPGIKIDEEYISAKMDQRRPVGKISTPRHEADIPEILSGVFGGYTTGTPLCLIIKNENVKSSDYDSVSRLARPSHADLTAKYKYGGFEDYRGGGHFSGRITAALVAAGSIVRKALEDKGIVIGTHIIECAGIKDRGFGAPGADLVSDLAEVNEKAFPVLDEQAAAEMRASIEAAAAEGDSVGGILETAVTGMPCGVGEPWFDTVESMLAHGIFAIPAVKGIEFGAGFDICRMKGSQANDAMKYDDGKVVTETNHSGGINGGITNGMPVLFRTAIKPTASIFKEQHTVDMASGEDAVLQLKGRHDPAIVHRASAVVDAVTALVLADLLTARYGTDYLRG
ncbi:MAG: chorismate synthase [Firmicutes bacterium]|nr:chorismate synthase [Bacillota bacterium]